MGEWIPEPLPDPAEWISVLGWRYRGGDPADRVTLDESVSMAFLVVLDSMTPAERVAFVLHDVFRYSFAEVAAIAAVPRRPAASWPPQPATALRWRSPRRLRPPQRARLVRDFKRAWEAQDIWRPHRPARPGRHDDRRRRRPGPRRAPTRSKAASRSRATPAGIAGRAPGHMTFLERMVNGQPGLVAQQDGVTVTVFAFDIAGGRIRHIWAVRNPDKPPALDEGLTCRPGVPQRPPGQLRTGSSSRCGDASAALTGSGPPGLVARPGPGATSRSRTGTAPPQLAQVPAASTPPPSAACWKTRRGPGLGVVLVSPGEQAAQHGPEGEPLAGQHVLVMPVRPRAARAAPRRR